METERANSGPRANTSSTLAFDPAWGGWLLGAALLLAAVLAFARLDHESLWFDEAWSVELAQRPLAETLSEYVQTNREGPPLYFFLLHGWMEIFGRGEVALRSLSACALIGAVLLHYAMARRLLGAPTAGVSSLLVASSPALLFYGQEVRNYSLILMLFSLSLYFFAKFIESHSAGDLVAVGLVNLAGLLTHVLMIEVILVESGALLLLYTCKSRLLAIWTLTHAFVGFAALPSFLVGRVFGGAADWMPHLNMASLFNAGLIFTGSRFVDDPWRASQLRLGSLSVLQWAQLTAVLALVVVGCATLLRSWQERSSEVRVAALLLSGLWLCVLAVPIALSFLGSSFFVPRYLIMGIPAFLTLATVGAFRLFHRKTLLFATVIVLVALNIGGAVRELDHRSKDNWRAAARIVSNAIRAGDSLVVSDARAKVPFDYYYDGRIAAVGVDGRLGHPADARDVDTELGELIRPAGTLWLVMPWGGTVDHSRIGLWLYLDSKPGRYRLLHEWKVPGSWGGIRIRRYAVRPMPPRG
jgi:4-amino-4-deoxy-L-arabinose transferase-like glycosyltransferase